MLEVHPILDQPMFIAANAFISVNGWFYATMISALSAKSPRLTQPAHFECCIVGRCVPGYQCELWSLCGTVNYALITHGCYRSCPTSNGNRLIMNDHNDWLRKVHCRMIAISDLAVKFKLNVHIISRPWSIHHLWLVVSWGIWVLSDSHKCRLNLSTCMVAVMIVMRLLQSYTYYNNTTVLSVSAFTDYSTIYNSIQYYSNTSVL